MKVNQKEKLVKEAQREVEVFLLQNFEDIEKVTVYEDGYKFYPADLGGLSISGYVNGNKDLFFNINFSTSDNQIGRVTSIVNADEFPPEKDEWIDDNCQYGIVDADKIDWF